MLCVSAIPVCLASASFNTATVDSTEDWPDNNLGRVKEFWAIGVDTFSESTLPAAQDTCCHKKTQAMVAAIVLNIIRILPESIMWHLRS